jgi:hypothetical protein
MPASSDLLTFAERALAWAGRAVAKPAHRMLWFALIALLATWPLLATAPALNAFRDAQVIAHYEQSAVESTVRFRELPLWDPYYCGGMYLLGTPQARFVSPTFLLTLLFGEARGEAITAFLMVIVGLEGMFRFARARGASSLGAALGAPVYALSGIFAQASLFSWTNFWGYELVPWAAWGFQRALEGSRGGMLLFAGALAWMVGLGGTYPAPMTGILCALLVVERIGSNVKDGRRALTALGGALAAGAFAAGIAAVRVAPILDTLEAAPRVIGGSPSNAILALARGLFLPIHASAGDYRGEAGAYFVGGLVMPALLFGTVRRGSRSLIAVAVAALWLASGYASSPSLFGLLRRAPLFSTLRYPERYLTIFALVGAVLAARGVGFAMCIVRKKKWTPSSAAPATAGSLRKLIRALPPLLAASLLFAIGPLVDNIHLAARGRELDAPPPQVARPFHQARGTRWALAQYAPMSRGCLSCWEAYPVPESPLLSADLEHEEYLVDAQAGRLVERAWSPNTIALSADLERPATVRVNQNFHPGWRISSDRGAALVTKNDEGLLAVDLPAGKTDFVLRFRPRSALSGAAASIVALVVGLWIVRERRRRGDRVRGAQWRALALAVVLPGAAFALVHAGIDERAPEIVPRAPTGEPVIADALPEGARAMHVRFGAGISLEGVRIAKPEIGPDDTQYIELDWKTEPGAERGLGIFMHLAPSEGIEQRGDHVLLSSTLDLEDAPPGKILRDVVPLSIGEEARNKKWTVWVGLWRARRDGSRVKVSEVVGGEVADDRVNVGRYEVH